MLTDNADQAAAAGPAGRMPAFHEFLRYVAVSAVALLVDVGVLWALAVRAGVAAPLAGAAAYAVGLAVHYGLAVSHVFGFRRFVHRPAAEFTLYAASGGAGIAISAAVLYAGERAGASLWTAKAVAVAIAFVATYAIRRVALFSPRGGARR